mmetsp:Transcript_107028/g.301131  ORF Transcript_107028/g.301131 Transcript_107028/m.301131 type:complete len:292 (+) Transcript_107028:800-1675(+)
MRVNVAAPGKTRNVVIGTISSRSPLLATRQSDTARPPRRRSAATQFPEARSSESWHVRLTSTVGQRSSHPLSRTCCHAELVTFSSAPTAISARPVCKSCSNGARQLSAQASRSSACLSNTSSSGDIENATMLASASCSRTSVSFHPWTENILIMERIVLTTQQHKITLVPRQKVLQGLSLGSATLAATRRGGAGVKLDVPAALGTVTRDIVLMGTASRPPQLSSCVEDRDNGGCWLTVSKLNNWRASSATSSERPVAFPRESRCEGRDLVDERKLASVDAWETPREIVRGE